jgi:hypothetical protein
MPKIDVEDINVDRSTSFEIPLKEYRDSLKDQFGNPIEYFDVKLTVSLTRGSDPLIEVIETGKSLNPTYKTETLRNKKTGYIETQIVLDDDMKPTLLPDKRESSFKHHRYYFNGIPKELIEKKGFKKAFELYYKPKVDKNNYLRTEVPAEIVGVKGLKTYVYVINWKGRHGGRQAATFHDEKQGVRFFEKDRDINLKEDDVLPEKWYKQIQGVGFKIHERQIPPEYRETKKAKSSLEDFGERVAKAKVQDYFDTVNMWKKGTYLRNYNPMSLDEFLDVRGFTPEKIEAAEKLYSELSSQGVRFIRIPKDLKKK